MLREGTKGEEREGSRLLGSRGVLTNGGCVCDSLHQQLEGGCTLRGSDIWVTATGETGVQAGQTEYLSPAGGIHIVQRCVYIFSLADLCCVQPEKAG